MTNKDLSVNPSKDITDMAYWDMSRLSYSDIEKLTGGEFTTPQELTSKSYSTEVEVTPNETVEWDIVKALDDEETDTQALAFKKR